MPFQFDIMRSSPSVRPYEQASDCQNISAAHSLSNNVSAYQHLALFLPFPAPQEDGSSLVLWRPCLYNWPERM